MPLTPESCEAPAWTSHLQNLRQQIRRCGAIPRWCSLPIWQGSLPSTPSGLAEIFAVNLQAFRGEGEWINVVV